ncbi:amino acid adenylation domain-containing protein [Solwaraspora sp. WMMD791]|uniref:non-ribosomal peptide synthetase n=1 Tax=Solwaraspora sp. WMMD791 TaxID=3016086 RepID=UPI00249B6304|nr:non-ribosomal peptide synthetase [Solwaraspora sp. WMMD791]WFE29897.1 amino acid adenylation domain-containing protein [Solwaraspora sp. WMMD791]
MLITDGPNGEKHLLDVLIAAADTAPDQTITHVRGDGAERVVTHRQLRDEALKVAGGLHEAGIAAGTPVILLADAGDDFQPMFWGALAAGLVPVPLPAEPTRVAGVRDLLGGVPVIVDDACAPVAQAADAPALHLATLRADGRTPRRLPAPDPDEPAFLQFSSGSTGTPRGVELRHRNVLANLRQIGQAAALTADDVSVSWMPYFHDMGLIGTHLAPLAARLRQVRIGPLTFAKRPLLWFSVAHRHRATLLSAANFALALAVRRVPAEALAGLDLSAVRLMMVGAEPISPVVWRAFVERTRPAGLDPAALQPVYGLAEATLAVTVPPLGETAVPVRVDRAALAAGTVQPAGEGDPGAVGFMDVGLPVPGCQVRIVDDAGNVVGGDGASQLVGADEAGRDLGDSRVGRIEVRGPNVAAGYHGDPAATAEVFVDGWLRTGDLGFLRDGRLCVTGRSKDVVFVNGRTFHAADLEEVVAGTAGLPSGRVAVLGCTDHASGAERIVVFVQWAGTMAPSADVAAVLAQVAARIVAATGHDQVRVLPVPPGAFPRTTSGKLRRPLLRQRYAAGDFAAVEQRWAPSPLPPSPAQDPDDLALIVEQSGQKFAITARSSGRWGAARSRDEVEQVVRAVWAKVLRRPADEIGLHDRFTTLGGSSLQAMEVLAGLEDAFGRELDPAELRERATVAALVDHLLTPGDDANGRTRHPAGGAAQGVADGAAAEVPTRSGDEVAVVGLACRFPGADSPDEFWRQLLDGRDSVSEIPAQRWQQDIGTARWGAFLDDPAGFDADFFGMSDTDADHTDPHARIFLELAHEALERAGYAGPRRHGRRVGVFAAVGESGYAELLRAQPESATHPAALVGNLRNLIPARVAQALDLTGPAIAVDTACSSALVALHLAVRSLRDGECDLAVVGGVNLNLTPTGHRLLAAAGALSATGRCRVFDAAADGFVPGEGGAALVLARAADARAAGDELLALVRGTAVNNDGRSLSLLAPNPLRQGEVITDAYRDNGVDPTMVSYIEAHGTGTELGDPVEVRSLAYAFPPRPDGRPRLLGSVKSNLGHLLNAAGMPALVKVILALRHRQLPPSLHVETPSPRLDLAGAGFEVVTGARDWVGDGPLTAGVNAFGFGGTNAHAILQEADPAPAPQQAGPAPQQAAGAASAGPYLVTCSAATEAALRQSLRDLAAHLDAHPQLDPGGVCATVNTARGDRPHRVAVVADSTAGLAAALAAAASGPVTEVVRRPRTAVVSLDDTADGETGPAAVCRRLADWGVVPDAVVGGGADQLRALLDQGYDVLLGVDAHRLTLAVREASPESADRVEVLSVPPPDDDGGLTGLVGALWQRGVAVDRVRTSGGRRRIAVPTYPFQRRRHWLPETTRDELVHQVRWSPLPLPLPAPAGRSPASVHLTGLDRALGGPLAAGLRDRLAADGVEIATGTGDAEVVVYLASGDPFDVDDGVAGLDAAVDATLHGVTGLVAALPEHGFRLLVITHDAVCTGVTGERPDPVQSLVTGLSAALADEHPDSVVSGMDLSSADDLPTRIDALAAELATMEASPDPAAVESRLVAWRAGQRLGRRLVPAAPISGESAAGNPSGEEPTDPVDADGVQLIVGGAGGVGAALAADLAARGHRRIVLAGRATAAPDGLVDRLRALGARVDYRRCDITDAADVDALIAGLPDLAGVFHAAGVVRPGPLRSRSVAQLQAVLAPKVRGGHLLVQALRRYGRRPATVVAFTSVSALLPGLAGAVGDYAAANAFLDTYATVEQAAGRPLRTVGFSALADAGMAAHPALAARLAARGLPALPFYDALPALRSALRRPADAHLVVARLTAANATAPVAAVTAGPQAVPSGDAGRQVHTPGEIRDMLRRLLADALDCDPARIDDDTPFLSLGLDSLTAIDLVKTLEGELGRPLPTMLLFEHGTIAALVDRLADPPPQPSAVTPPADGGAEPFALSGVQRAFHTLHRLYPHVAAYGFVRHAVTGPLDADLLGQALDQLPHRHPMLRMRWVDGDGDATPRQLIGPPTPLTDWYAVHDAGQAGGDGDVDALTERLCNEPIDLTCRPPLRAVLIRTGPADAQLLLVLHHAAGDGASLSVLSEELWQVYGALAAGRVPQLPPVPTTFRDHLAAAAPASAEDLAFWRETLAAWPAGLRLPWRDPAAPPAPPYAAHRVSVDPPTVAALTRVAAAARVSLFHLLLAGYARCLARATGQRIVTVSVARAGRDARLPGVDRVVGPFADTLPLTVDVDPAEPAVDLAHRVLAAWLVAQRHGTVDAVDLARATPRPDDPAGGGVGGRPVTASPASFSFARFPVVSDADLPVRVSPVAAGTASAGTRLGLLCWQDGERLRFAWNHPVASLDRATVAGLAAEFLAELADLAKLAESTSAESVEGASPSVVERIGQVCRRHADAVAVESGPVRMTYRQLDGAADRVAAALRRTGVRAGDLVGLLAARGPAAVAAVVGVLRAGAGWVPLDLAHPPARHRDQLRRAGVRVLLHDAASTVLADALDDAQAGLRAVDIDTIIANETTVEPVADGAAAADPDGTAYVIFTSGSTGRPKGVPVSHRSMANYLRWAVDTFGYHSGDRLAQTSSWCFDASVRQLLAPLLVGATVVVLDQRLLRDPDEVLRRVEHDRITVWSSVPTLWSQLLAAARRRTASGGRPDLSALRWIHVGGEALPPGQVRGWFDLFGPGHRITNLYGPTEATINAAWFLIDRRPADGLRRVPIGRPVAGATLAVVDADGRACPPGAAGELQIAGPGLTSGYLDDPEQTQAAFVHRDGRRWYRSGDRARVGPTGDLEFLGRLDDQVKLHGHRIEPGEIEAALSDHPAVSGAAVLHQATPYSRLIAFVQLAGDVADDPTPVTAGDPTIAAALRRHLADRLPPQWVPARIRPVRALPLTATGKVDRHLLAGLLDDEPDPVAGGAPSPDDGQVPGAGDEPLPKAGAGPRTSTERQVAQVWQAVLGVPTVHRDDDFFALGGDSIVAIEVFARLRERFPAAPGPAVIYDHRTLAGLAAAIDTATSGSETAPDAAPEPEPAPAVDAYDPRPFPLSAAQRGFLLAEAAAPGSSSTWLARLRLAGRLDRRRFQRAVDSVVARHPMLRTVFPAGARPPVQQELPATLRLPVRFERVESAARVADLVARERQRPVEPWSWPLLRLLVLTLTPDEHVLVVHAHHLIGDGYSAALLGQELLARYDDPATGAAAPPRTTFRDYVDWLHRQVPDPVALRWWRERFASPYRPPTLRASTADGGARARTGGFTLDGTVAAGLRRLAAAAGTTGYAPVLTAYHRGLVRLTGQGDLVVGLTVTGRDHPLPDLHRLFGPCAVLLPLRLTDTARSGDAGPGDGRSGDGGFGADLARVAAEVAAGRRHGPDSVPASVDGGPSALLGAQFIFSSLDFTGLGPTAAGGLTVEPDDTDSELEPPPVGTDVLLTVRPVGDGLRVFVRAASAAMDADRLAGFVAAIEADLISAAVGTDRADTDRAAGTTGPDRVTSVGTALDAAIVGYLPAPAQLAALAGMSAVELPRERIRELLFPTGAPRLLEELVTPFGRSGFVCLPVFADELGPDLAPVTADAVRLAARAGARCVSMAGMLPSVTGYGFDVVRQVGSAVRVTTGHAATATSVVLTTLAALAAAGRDLTAGPLAVVGLGSIGRSAVELLLRHGGPHPPRIVLADLPASRQRLADYPDRLRRLGFRGELVWADSTPAVAPAVYAAATIVAAVSSPAEIVDVDLLRPGTVLVDDSFPYCVDPGAALDRMRRDGDVLVVGGGLLTCGTVRRLLPAGLPPVAVAGYAARGALPDAVASCQVESLLQAARPELPLVHGLVRAELAAAYWSAARAVGITAAPLHLAGTPVADLVAGRLGRRRALGQGGRT